MTSQVSMSRRLPSPILGRVVQCELRLLATSARHPLNTARVPPRRDQPLGHSLPLPVKEVAVVSDGLGPIPPLAETMPNQRTPAPPCACSQSLSLIRNWLAPRSWTFGTPSAHPKRGPKGRRIPSLEGPVESRRSRGRRVRCALRHAGAPMRLATLWVREVKIRANDLVAE